MVNLNRSAANMGLWNTSAHQVSGKPWFTSSFCTGSAPTDLRFPYVSKFFTIKISSSVAADTLLVAAHTGAFTTGNYFTLVQGETFSSEMAVANMYVLAVGIGEVGFEAVATLTPIDRLEIEEVEESYLSGSGIWNSP